jgi:hypothetical protein
MSSGFIGDLKPELERIAKAIDRLAAAQERLASAAEGTQKGEYYETAQTKDE